MKTPLLAVTLLAILAGRVEAAFYVNIIQNGPNVIVLGSGSLNTSGLSSSVTTLPSNGIGPSTPTMILGKPNTPVRIYNAYFTNQASFGPGPLTSTSNGTLDTIGFSAALGTLYAVPNYLSGSFAVASIEISNQTIASLGVSSGRYTYSYSATRGGPILDSITITVDPVVTVPEPASLILVGVALVGATLIARRAS